MIGLQSRHPGRMETLSAAQPGVKQITATVEVSLKMIVEAATEAIWPEVPAYGGSTMTSPAPRRRAAARGDRPVPELFLDE